MRIDRAAVPFVLIAALPAVGAGLAWGSMAAAIALVLPVAVGLFFRDPDRTPSQDPSLVLSPADGTVKHAGPALPGDAPDTGAWLQITIFLSVLDVHINRTPVSGRVTRGIQELCLGAAVFEDLIGGADAQEFAILDGGGLSGGLFRVEGGDLSVGQNEVGVRKVGLCHGASC
jgi:hypothetical protein